MARLLVEVHLVSNTDHLWSGFETRCNIHVASISTLNLEGRIVGSHAANCIHLWKFIFEDRLDVAIYF